MRESKQGGTQEVLRNRTYSSKEIREATGPLRTVAELLHGKTLLRKLADAVRGSGEITVYGDYDADGIMAAYILHSGISRLAPGRVHWFINNRYDDGYNITTDSMKKCLFRYPQTKTLITCDNGINAADAVDYATELGITVLVTDHHVQTVPLREDCPAVDECSIGQMRRDAEEGISPEAFCGAELARRVVEALYDREGIAAEHAGFLQGLYAYSGLATITDHVPMNPSNHFVARKGLGIIQKNEGFWGLLKEAFPAQNRPVHWDTIGFYYGPLINASGRMTGEATLAMNMLLAYDSGDEQACRESIRALAECNLRRRLLCDADDRRAREIIAAGQLENMPFILVWSEDFSEGVNGLTATRITQRYRVPSAVLSPVKNNPELYKGSARSVEGANLIGLLQAHAGLVQAGGHAMAAGITIRREHLETVRQLLCEDLRGFQPPPEPEPDFYYKTTDLTMQDVAFQDRLTEEYEPFGPGFEEPRIAFSGTPTGLWEKKKRDANEAVHATFPMGKSADHYFVNANWWNHLEDAKKWYRQGKTLHCTGKAERNAYTDRGGNERVSIQITIDRILEEYGG